MPIIDLAEKHGCKVFITGDHEQLTAVESGGGMTMLAGHETLDEGDYPGVTNALLSETAARGLYRRWFQHLGAERWADLEQSDRAFAVEIGATT